MQFSPVIVHYHAFPGGVSSLILKSLDILVSRNYILNDITIILGTLDRSEWFFEELKLITAKKIKVRIEVVPEIFYWDSAHGKPADVAERIQEKLLKAAGPDRILWVQNPTLGRNPALFMAVRRIARKEPDRKIWLHVHDSAEQGRWSNLALMHTHIGEPYYFDAPGTRWITINRNDYTAYKFSGMPIEHLHYVPNPLTHPLMADSPPARATVAAKLADYAAQNGFTFNRKSPWLLFAGRAIRRKNLLEAALISLCASKKPNLLVTLPADAPDEKPYEEAVFSTLRTYKVGVAGFGPQLIANDFTLIDLACASDAIISCSVMEGFGLPYLEFPILGKSLFAKKIYVMDDFSGIAHLLPHNYYSELIVPADKKTRETQFAEYEKKISILRGRFGISHTDAEKTLALLRDHFSQEKIYFSYLSVPAQINFIKQAVETKMLGEIHAYNPEVFTMLSNALSSGCHDVERVSSSINTLFGPEIYARNIESLLNSYKTTHHNIKLPAFNPPEFAHKLLTYFFIPENLRLLLDYGDWK